MNKNIKSIIEKIRNNENLTDAEKMLFINYSMAEHGGKLEGISSISTSCLCNKYCIARSQDPESICSECYAMGYCGFRKSLKDKLEVNTLFYSNYTIPEKSVPLINSIVFRFESFGDLNNERQFANHCMIAKANKNVHFGLWTKNIFIIEKAVKAGLRIPANMKIIYSIPKVNQDISKDYFRQLKSKYPFIHAVFAVYTDEYITENSITINCGGKSCQDCGYTCYLKSNRTALIRERKK